MSNLTLNPSSLDYESVYHFFVHCKGLILQADSSISHHRRLTMLSGANLLHCTYLCFVFLLIRPYTTVCRLFDKHMPRCILLFPIFSLFIQNYMMSTSYFSPYNYTCTEIIHSKPPRKTPMNVKLRCTHRIMLGIKNVYIFIFIR